MLCVYIYLYVRTCVQTTHTYMRMHRYDIHIKIKIHVNIISLCMYTFAYLEALPGFADCPLVSTLSRSHIDSLTHSALYLSVPRS